MPNKDQIVPRRMPKNRPKFEPPTATFPYKIGQRLELLSRPRRYYLEMQEDLPTFTKAGVRVSAIRGSVADRCTDIALPWLRRLLLTRRMYKNKFSQHRLECIDKMIEAANATFYSKLANVAIDTKKQDLKDHRKKKAWSESEWKRHMEYINQIAGPKKECEPTVIMRGASKPLSALLPRINAISSQPDFKQYRRESQEDWYRNPSKVSPKALKYNITERILVLSKPRPYRGLE